MTEFEAIGTEQGPLTLRTGTQEGKCPHNTDHTLGSSISSDIQSEFLNIQLKHVTH